MKRSEYNILVLMPVTLRPKIFKKTLKSFKNLMFDRFKEPGVKINFYFALHIDPVPKDSSWTALDIEYNFLRYEFKTAVIKKNYSEMHSLANAFYWLWGYADTHRLDYQYVFYLEDDWELVQKVNPFRMIEIMENNPSLATLRLNFKPADETYAKQWRHLFPWNGEYFECPVKDKNYIGWCGHPNLVNVGFIRDTLPIISGMNCPERQMKGVYGETLMRQIIQKWNYGVFGAPMKGPYVRDIGRKWRAQHNLVKLKTTSWFPAKKIRENR
jgi:hypothetical protein